MFEDLKKRFRSFTNFISPRAQSLARRAVDVVSPNTPQDIARRQAAGQPASYQAQQAQLQAQRDAARARVQALKPTQRIISVTPQQRSFEQNARIAQQGIAAGQRPSYGGGIGGLFRRAQDVVSADTAQDIYNRAQQAQGLAPKGTITTYEQQQRALGNIAPASNPLEMARNLTVGAIRDTAKSGIKTGLTIGNIASQKLFPGTKISAEYQPTGIAKTLLGKEKIGTISAYGREMGLPGFRSGKPAAILGGIVTALDATPLVGGLAKEALNKVLPLSKSLALTTKTDDVIRLLDQEGIQATDDIVKRITKSRNPKTIETELTKSIEAQTARDAAKAAEVGAKTTVQDLGRGIISGAQQTGARNVVSALAPQRINDNLVTELQKTRTPQQAQDTVRALFPDKTATEQSRIATELANTKDAAAIRKTLEDAQTRRTAVSEGIQQVVPTAPVRQAEVIQQAAEAPAIAAPTPRQALPEAQIAEVPPSKPITVYSSGEKGGTNFATTDLNFSKEQFGGAGKVTEKRTIDPTQYLDTRNPEQRAQLESILGKDRVNEFISRTDNGLPAHTQLGEEDALRQASDALGYKGIVISETDKLTKYKGRDVLSYVDNPPKTGQDWYQRVTAQTQAGETLLEQSQRTGLTPSEILYGTPTPSPEQQLNFLQQISPNRFVRENITRPIVNQLNAIVGQAQLSNVAAVRGLGRLPVGLSKEIGMTPELLAASRKFLTGTGELGKITADDIVKIGKELDTSAVNRVWATLDPERAAELGIDVNKVNLSPAEITYKNKIEELKNAFTQGNVSRGLITQEQADAEWFKRAYSTFDFASTDDQFYKQTLQQMFGQTKIKKQFAGRKTISDEIKQAAIQDPSYLMAKKSAESHAAWGVYDYTDFLNKNGFVSDVERPGYVQLPNNKLYGESAGKYVPRNAAEEITGFQSGYAVLNSLNDVLNWYDKNPLRKGKKMILTVLNPAVRAGNKVSNVIFAQLNGINPVTFTKNLAQVRKLEESRAPIYLEAVQRGLVGNDLMSGDFGRKIAEYTGDPQGIKKALNWAKKSYSKADDNAKVAAFKSHVDRGYTFDQAAQLVQRGFQDSKSVGYFYDTAAKIPLVGNAFVRFAGDASRILTNAVIDNPLTVAGTVATVATLGNALSKLSGETPEDKKTREGRFGAPTIPFTNISLEFQTPYGAVNVARFLPFYELNDVGNPVTRFLPFSGNPTDPKNWSDPLLGTVGQLITDKDFRGKSIKDPENTGQFLDRLSGKQELINRAKFAIPQNIPLGREATAIYQAATGQPDIYGKERSLSQALLRAGGIKVEQFGTAQAEKLRNQQRFQEDKKRIEQTAATLPKDSQEAYKRLTGYYKLRDKTANQYAPGTERFIKAPVYNFAEDKYRDIAKDPKVYDLLLQKKIQDNQRDGTPIAPEFDTRLSNEFRRQLIANKAIAPGDDAETDAKIRTSAEWDLYTQLKDQYGKDLKAKYGAGDKKFVDELVKNPDKAYPQKGAAKVAYDNAYKLYAQGLGPKPAFTDAVAADKDAYEENMRNWTNDARKARGLPPISKDVWDNVSFGFQSDEEKIYKELKYGRGFGRFGFGGGGPQEQRQYLTQLLGQGVSVAQAPEIKATPTRFKVKVQKPSKGRKARIRLG